MPPAKPSVAPKRRNRKRKRRAASSSSDSSDSDSDSASDVQPTVKPLVAAVSHKQLESEASEDSSSSSSSSSDSESDVSSPRKFATTTIPTGTSDTAQQKRRPQSPSPPPVEIPSFIPPTELSGPSEDILKTRFRKFYMSTVADGFRDDLEEIRKEPNLGKSRLEMLVESLAAGSEVFSPTEMEIVLDGGHRP